MYKCLLKCEHWQNKCYLWANYIFSDIYPDIHITSTTLQNVLGIQENISILVNIDLYI